MKRYLLASAVMIAFVPFKAQAAQIDAAGAAHLKDVFTKYIKNQEEVQEAAGGLDIVIDGEVTVEPKGEYYAVILPKISLQPSEKLKKTITDASPVPKEGEKPEDTSAVQQDFPAFTFDLGQTAINAIPDDKPGLWKVTIAFPGSMSFGVQDEFSLQVAIGEQNTSGLLHEVSGNLLKLESVLKNVKINASSGGETSEFTIPELGMTANYEDDGQGYISGPSTVRISGMGFDIPEDGGRIDFGSLEVSSILTRYKMISSDEYKNHMIAFNKKMIEFEKSGETGTPPSAEMIDEAIAVIAALCDFEGITATYTLKNFSVKPGASSPAPAQSVNLDTATFGIGLNQLKSDTGELSFKLAYNGVKLDPEPQGFEGIIPDSVNVDLSLAKIPLQSLWATGLNAGKTLAANPEAGAMAGMGLMMQVPMMLSQSGTEIVIKDNAIAGKDYKASLNGQVKADVKALMQFVADLKGRFDGLDGLLARVKEKASDPNHPNAYELNDVASQLEMLKGYGAPSAGPDGKQGYDFDIKVTPDGKATVNGKDIMGGAEGTAQNAPEAQTPAAGEGKEGGELPY